ncbi:MAG: carbonic anhydrase, partial [Proteobacteria bacterium]|nr:carbonic anhydrase [Pseudomonadota bacterium]
MSLLPEHLSDRYRRFRFRHYAPNQGRYEELAEHGQAPDVMVVSCCDSRVDPETIFSAMPGELFVVRNVANLVPPYETSGKYHGVSAALEFATLNLRVHHILVLGHSGCGGVRACLEHDAARQTEAQFISNWMSMLDGARDDVRRDHGDRPVSEMTAALEREGVKASLANLRTFPCIQILE